MVLWGMGFKKVKNDCLLWLWLSALHNNTTFVSTFLTRLWSVHTALTSDTQNKDFNSVYIRINSKTNGKQK